MQALPIFFNIKNRHCVVIGGGDVAMRKVTMLLKASAAITLYSPDICHELQDLVDAQKIKFVAEKFEQNQLLGACMVIAATDDEAVNTAVSIAAISPYPSRQRRKISQSMWWMRLIYARLPWGVLLTAAQW
jgi:uroporphyrin-III C-methyltransferase/precorrin-2 dehydrogenase/sirohydrochlorin ferrochelatase